MIDADEAPLPVVAILGDSRAFDTYYVNDSYPAASRYGYEKTFPCLLRRAMLQNARPECDVIHIPDHFRGGTVENNIIRLGLTDPAVVVLCDGIWETLVHKDWFISWATNKVRSHPTQGGGMLDISYSSRILADLFIAGELSVSPGSYAAKQRRIISYFRRRRRQCIWLSLTTPPRDHLGRLHFAGAYRCIPEWDECLAAVNRSMKPIIDCYGADWLDLASLALSEGGYGQALIDQWHFSKRFHSAIASDIAGRLPRLLEQARITEGHISRDFLLSRDLGDTSILVHGSPARIEQWRNANATARVRAVLIDEDRTTQIAGLPTVSIGDSDRLDVRCVILVDGPDTAPDAEASLLNRLPLGTILLYPSELGAIENPAGTDRAEHGQLRR